jgi:hypothetical protein
MLRMVLYAHISVRVALDDNGSRRCNMASKSEFQAATSPTVNSSSVKFPAGHSRARFGPQMGHKAKRPLRGGRCFRGFHLGNAVVAGAGFEPTTFGL